MARKKKTEEVKKEKSINELAQEVLNGDWGTGRERRKLLEAAGYNYFKVQAKVISILYGRNEN